MKTSVRTALLAAGLVLIVTIFWMVTRLQPANTTVRFAVSPFQDTLLPIVGEEKGWYAQEGVRVEFSVLGWTEVMEALASHRVDVAISNISAVVSVHERNPDVVYWYGLNPFDNGFALMIRPNGPLKTLEQIMQSARVSREEAVRETAAQLRGKTVITTGKTDMEQGVAAAARRGGLRFPEDVKVIDLNPDEGLAAFLGGEGDAYIGGIPQRTTAGKRGMIEMLTGADIGPAPINGIVTTRSFASSHPRELLAILRVWFKTVKYINSNMADGAAPILRRLNQSSGGGMSLEDFKRFWNNYEHYPASPREVQTLILDSSGRNYWRARWDDCNWYFFNVTKTISKPVDPLEAFLMLDVQREYVSTYGWE